MEPDKKLEIESRRRGEKLIRLQDSPDWWAVVEIYEGLSKHWRSGLLVLSDEDSIEKIAKERLKWLHMLKGLEVFFAQMQEDIDLAKTKEEEDDVEDEELPMKKSENPYRKQEE